MNRWYPRLRNRPAQAREADCSSPSQRARAVKCHRCGGSALSYFAAAALWGIRILGRWPELVNVTIDRAAGGRSDGALRRHCVGLESTEIVVLDGLTVTSPAQTVVDLVRMLQFADAIVAASPALRPAGSRRSAFDETSSMIDAGMIDPRGRYTHEDAGVTTSTVFCEMQALIRSSPGSLRKNGTCDWGPFESHRDCAQ